MNQQQAARSLAQPFGRARSDWEELLPTLLVLGLAMFLVWVIELLFQKEPQTVLLIAIIYALWESGMNTLLVVLSGWGLFRPPNVSGRKFVPIPKLEGATPFEGSDGIPTTSVLIAAYNESSCILETIQSVIKQNRPVLEIIIASDGSSDGMDQLLVERLDLGPTQESGFYETILENQTRLVLLALPRRGKGFALNSALQVATGEVLVTLDADTQLEPNALEELSRPFLDPRTAAAGGFIFVRNADTGPWITKRQYLEYIKNFLWRIGLAQAGVCLQVSGAFGAFRRKLLLQLGGFSTDSLVEDYEIIYRLHQELLKRGEPYWVTIAPLAVAYTDGPETVLSFIRQRTRWFAGFLQTLWDYRAMVFNWRYGRIGWFMLPVKVIDTILPIWGLGSLAILLVAIVAGHAQWSKDAILIFCLKWLYDVGLTTLLLSWVRRLFPRYRFLLSLRRIAYCVMTEGFIFHWFRQAAVLNAYGWMISRVRRWEQSRWNSPSTMANLSARPRF